MRPASLARAWCGRGLSWPAKKRVIHAGSHEAGSAPSRLVVLPSAHHPNIFAASLGPGDRGGGGDDERRPATNTT